jgi:hypothetical protein
VRVTKRALSHSVCHFELNHTPKALSFRTGRYRREICWWQRTADSSRDEARVGMTKRERDAPAGADRAEIMAVG